MLNLLKTMVGFPKQKMDLLSIIFMMKSLFGRWGSIVVQESKGKLAKLKGLHTIILSCEH